MPITDDEFRSLFSAFDDVSASDELKDATLARILAANVDAESESSDPDHQGALAQTKAVAGGKAPIPTKRAKWRAIRIGAIAACLSLALTGGVAYATPTSYYDIVQDGTTISLGVNCFGITVSATSPDEEGQELVDKSDLCNIPYEESLERAVKSMEDRDPNTPVEYGPQGGEHEVLQPQNAPDGSNDQGGPEAQGEPSGSAKPNDGCEPADRPQGEGQSRDDGQPQDEGKPRYDGQQQSESQPSGAPQDMSGKPGGQNGNNRQ